MNIMFFFVFTRKLSSAGRWVARLREDGADRGPAASDGSGLDLQPLV